QSRVVVYYGKDWVSPSTRILFTLDYAGLGKRASLLDGGMDAWIRNGGVVTKEVPPARKGSLAPVKVRPIVVDAKFVRDHIAVPHYAIVDGRDAVFYDGVDTGEHMGEKQRTGHIPSAHSIPYTSITDDNFNLKSPGDLQALVTNWGVN